MNAFSKKPLIVALGAAAAMASGAASAVNVSADYLGQVLIFPYYTVNSAPGSKAFNTLFNIVNTQPIAKAVKVRFREALNSREVLDFNVFLSPSDVWTASVTPTSAGGAQITTSDLSCTLPKFVGSQVPFRSDAYVGDGGGNAITRTAEGYIEVFEMATFPNGTATQKSVTHNQSKSPPTPVCDETNAGALADQKAPTGGVTGSLVLVNPQVGGSFPVAPTVLDNFRDTAYYADTGSVLPNYSQVNPPFSFTVKGATAWLGVWTPGNDAVTAVLRSRLQIHGR